MGNDFEEDVMNWLNDNCSKDYTRDEQFCTFNIGEPPKPRKFDIVSKDRSVVIECKCFTWTKSGGTPHGKMKSISEAVLRLSFITNADTYIVIKRDLRLKSSESLAEYYFRRFGNMLRGTRILEFDEKIGELREITE